MLTLPAGRMISRPATDVVTRWQVGAFAPSRTAALLESATKPFSHTVAVMVNSREALYRSLARKTRPLYLGGLCRGAVRAGAHIAAGCRSTTSSTPFRRASPPARRRVPPMASITVRCLVTDAARAAMSRET